MRAVLFSMLLAGIATPALAQTAPADDPKPADVVVTGRSFVVDQAASAAKTDLPIVRTPQAVSVVDSDFIDTLNLRTVAEALNYTSGVRSQAFGSDTRIDYYQIRGFANANFFKDGGPVGRLFTGCCVFEREAGSCVKPKPMTNVSRASPRLRFVWLSTQAASQPVFSTPIAIPGLRYLFASAL